MTGSFLAATSGPCSRFLVLMSISPEALHDFRVLSLYTSEQTRRACYIDIDPKVFFIGYARGPAEEFAQIVAVCDEVELPVVEARMHIVDGSE